MVRKQNAMLTKTDREFLLAGGEYYTGDGAKQMRYERRANIRSRVRESLLDFSVLFDQMPGSENRKIFKNKDEAENWVRDQDVQEGCRDALAYILYNHNVTHLMGISEPVHGNAATELLESAYKRAGLKVNRYVTNVEQPEIEAVNLRNIFNRLQEGEGEETAHNLGLVLQTGEVGDETRAKIQELIEDDLADDAEE